MNLLRTLALAAALALPLPAAAEMPAAEREEIERIVRDYLLANPEVLETALQGLEAKRREEEEQARRAAIAENRALIFDSERQAVVGNPEGKVTLVEFFDYNCGYCKRAMSDMLALMEKNPDLRVVLKEMPILSEGSLEAAKVGVAVETIAPEKYLDFHRAMFERGGQANKEKAMAVVADLGLDAKKIEEVSESEETRAALVEVSELAQKLGVTGTPSYVVGDNAVFGAIGYEMLQALVEDAGKKAAPTAAN